AGGDGQTCVAPRVVAHAAPGTPGGPPVLDGPGAGGSGVVRPLAVSAPHPAGVAPVFAHQHGRNFPSYGPGARGSPEDVGAGAGPDVAGDGYRLQRPASPAPLYAVGLLGGRRQGAVVDADGSAAGGQYRLLVWVAGLA